ncbi:MAG: CCA tRNA nucleotidyltransferase [Muribaculaceae bacterium]|nr:CCA tRNA nucleotidyltransferase [Muribaculaceae bacterium]
MTIETYHDICSYLRKLIEGSQWESKVYTVGGCCRDLVMALPINDIDLAVNAPNGGIEFAEWLYEKGLTSDKPIEFHKYGTARLHLKEFDDEELEIVQTRKEKYTDRTSRNPAIAFGSVDDDCMRRDLTINALYYDISNDKLLDVCGRSISDIRDKIIRTPTDPNVTFDDDPVRILRTIRFATRFGWEIEKSTFDAMCRHCSRLDIIKPERMQTEFEKILIGPTPSRALDLLRHTGAMAYIIPELCETFNMRQASFHFGSVWEHSISVVDKVAPTPLLRISALLHDIGKISSRFVKPDGTICFPRHPKRATPIIIRILSRLSYRMSFIKHVLFLCNNHEVAKHCGSNAEGMTDADLRELLFFCRTRQRFENLMSIIDADNRSYAPDHCMPQQAKNILSRTNTMIENGEDMFSYVLPIKQAKIAKIKQIKNNKKASEAYKKYLMSLVFAKPDITNEELIKNLKLYQLE